MKRKIPIEKKEKFIRKYWDLAVKAFSFDYIESEKKLIKKARSFLGYSPKTVDIDIVSSLCRVYRAIGVKT